MRGTLKFGSAAKAPAGAALDFDDRRALAALRVVIAALILVSPELSRALELAARPSELVFVPEGAELFAALPLTPPVVRALHAVALSSGATALLGFWSRTSMAVLTLTALPLYSLSQRSGAVLHDMHLFWMSALLAVSPCGDAWSLDSWGEGTALEPRRYRVPANFARAFLGVIYFFPGLHKLLESGPSWASSSNLIGHMHAKWLQMGEVPALRVDHFPGVCTAAGLFVLAFELSFIALVASPRTRVLALGSGLLFHAATQIFLFIPFASLWACYVLLVPFGRFGGSAKGRAPRERAGAAPLARYAPMVVGSAVLALATLQGVRGQMQAWPFACYPTFQWKQGSTLPDLTMEARLSSGSVVTFNGRERRPRSQAEWGRVFRLSGAWGDPLKGAQLVEHALEAARAAGIALDPGAQIRVYRAAYDTQPERWNDPPRERRLLGSFVVGTGTFLAVRAAVSGARAP